MERVVEDWGVYGDITETVEYIKLDNGDWKGVVTERRTKLYE